MKIVSWNVNGLRAILGKGFLEILEKSEADVFCLQEIKARPEQVTADFGEYAVQWNPADRPGYSGTATLTRRRPLSVSVGLESFGEETEGRVLTTEFQDFYVVNAYVPNAGRTLNRLDYRIHEWGPAFRKFLEALQARKPLIVCGDLNVAHREIDLARPRENVGNAGFTEEERSDFDRLLEVGLVDGYRHFEKSGGRYTWWSYQSQARARNIGWRIDYTCVSERLLSSVRSVAIHADVTGSDHCPVEITLQ